MTHNTKKTTPLPVLRRLTTLSQGLFVALGFATAAFVGCFIGHATPGSLTLDDIGNLSSGLSAAATVIAVWVAWRGFAESQANSRKEYRAYIAVSIHDLRFNEARDTLVLQLAVHNYGRTPAEEVKIRVKIEIEIADAPNFVLGASENTFNRLHPTSQAKPLAHQNLKTVDQMIAGGVAFDPTTDKSLSFPMSGTWEASYTDVFGNFHSELNKFSAADFSSASANFKVYSPAPINS